MNASDLIADLQKLVDKHGDLPVTVANLSSEFSLRGPWHQMEGPLEIIADRQNQSPPDRFVFEIKDDIPDSNYEAARMFRVSLPIQIMTLPISPLAHNPPLSSDPRRVTDQELDDLKNTNIDLGSVGKSAAEVDPAKVKVRKTNGIRALVGNLGVAAYMTTIRPFGCEVDNKLREAIVVLNSAIAADTPLRGRVEHVVMLAEMLLAALNAIPPRQASGAIALATECEKLAGMFPD